MLKKILAGVGATVLGVEALWLGSLIVRSEVRLRELSLLAEQAEDDAGRIVKLYTNLSRSTKVS